MAIAIDTIGTVTNQASTTGFTFSATVGAGLLNSILVLYAQVHTNLGISISAATYNGVALTKIIRENDGVRNATVEIWYLKAPASGSNTVSITLTGGTATFFDAVCISYTGVDQTTPIDIAGIGTVVVSSSTTVSLSPTTVTNNAWAIDCLDAGGTPTMAVTGGQTIDVNSTNSNGEKLCVSHKLVAAAGSTTVSWSMTPSTSGAAAYAVAALRPAAATNLFRPPDLSGMGSGGPFFHNPVS